MARSCTPGPAVPSTAERARAVAARAGGAAVIAGPASPAEPLPRGEGAPDPAGDDLARVTPTLHHVPPTGAATLQLPDDHPMVAHARARGSAQLPVMLELTDSAPVRLRHPVRGLLWITGRLRVLPERVARRAALRIAAELPDERLLDVGHGETLLRLDPVSVVLSDAEGSAALSPGEMAAATPDPLAGIADGWLAHLADAHPGMLQGMVAHLPPSLRRGGHVAPLALDRLGLRLRVETADADHDVRLGFSEPVACPRRLGEEMRRLAGLRSGPPSFPERREHHRRRAADG